MRDKSGKFSLIYQWSLIIFGLLFPIFVISTLNTKIFLAIRSRVKYRVENPATSTVSPNGDHGTESTEYEVGEKGVSTGCPSADSATSQSTIASSVPFQKCKRKPLSKKDRSLVNILLVVTVTFVVFNTPQVLRGAVNYMKPMDGEKTHAERAAVHFAWAFTNTLSTVNYAINFYLYCLSSRKFRKDLSYVFGKCSK